MNKSESIHAAIALLKEVSSKEEYYGKWVAISDGKLLDVSDQYKELYDKHKDVENVFITRIV
jgi:hypothetical protein